MSDREWREALRGGDESTPEERTNLLCVSLRTGAVGVGLFWDLFRRLEAAERFSAGDRVSELLRDADVLLQVAREGGREVLRLLFPAKNGALPGEADYPEDHAPLRTSLDSEDPPWDDWGEASG